MVLILRAYLERTDSEEKSKNSSYEKDREENLDWKVSSLLVCTVVVIGEVAGVIVIAGTSSSSIIGSIIVGIVDSEVEVVIVVDRIRGALILPVVSRLVVIIVEAASLKLPPSILPVGILTSYSSSATNSILFRR